MSIVLPTLSADNYLKSSLIMMDRLFAYFLASDYSESFIYKGTISSFSYIIEKYNDNIDDIVSNTKQTLELLYKRYFNDVTVKVRSEEDLSHKGLYTLFISLETIDEKAVSRTLAKALQIKDSKVLKIEDINYG